MTAGNNKYRGEGVKEDLVLKRHAGQGDISKDAELQDMEEVKTSKRRS